MTLMRNAQGHCHVRITSASTPFKNSMTAASTHMNVEVKQIAATLSCINSDADNGKELVDSTMTV